MATLNRLLRSLADTVLRETVRHLQQPRSGTTSDTAPEGTPTGAKPSRRSSPRPKDRSAGRRTPAAPAGSSDYPGDFTGVPALRYQPEDDSDADPGEVVWTWVPYEEDHSRGKDRPVLVIGHDGPWLLALPMSSVDHDRDARQEAAAGRYWQDIGSGAWDREGRDSEVRVNRILRVDPQGIRRIAARLDYDRFEAVAREVMRHYG